MVDWVTLGALVAMVAAIAGIFVPIFLSLKKDILNVKIELEKQISSVKMDIKALNQEIDSKFGESDRRFDQVYMQLIEINRRLPVTPELLVASRERW